MLYAHIVNALAAEKYLFVHCFVLQLQACLENCTDSYVLDLAPLDALGLMLLASPYEEVLQEAFNLGKCVNRLMSGGVFSTFSKHFASKLLLLAKKLPKTVTVRSRRGSTTSSPAVEEYSPEEVRFFVCYWGNAFDRFV